MLWLMTCLHLEGVPEELAEALYEIARRQHDSVSHVAVAILRRALLSPKARQGTLFPRLAAPARRQRESPAEAASGSAAASARDERRRAAEDTVRETDRAASDSEGTDR
jgi:hypothetical protein